MSTIIILMGRRFGKTTLVRNYIKRRLKQFECANDLTRKQFNINLKVIFPERGK